jgi:hypothetical protein
MKIHRQASKILAGALALVCIGQAALADWEYTPGKGIKIDIAEGKAFTAAFDVRVRLTSIDRNVIWPEGPPQVAAVGNGPSIDWLRVRTRLSLGLDLWDGAKLNARFVNRMHNYSSHFIDENDNGAGTWQYPDEIIVDQLKLTTGLGIEGLSATLGRQAFILGNGMVMLEGTPYDQGRTIYFDGLAIRYKNECDAIALFAFYNEAEDEFVVAGDEDRVLRRGDIFTTGIDWTHTFNNSLSSELYYIYANVDDNDTTMGMREFPANSVAELHTVGARLFGSPTENIDYSVEVAHMFGDYDESPVYPAPKVPMAADADSWMVDARLTFKALDVWAKPSVMLQYTYFSGDDPDSDDFEGWDGLFANYPIYGEELLPILNNGNWTNLHQFRVQAKAQLHERVALTAAYAHLRADEADTAMTSGGGTGDSHFGDLFSAFLDFTVNDYVEISLQAAFFESGDYWDTNADSEWLRMQTVFTF